MWQNMAKGTDGCIGYPFSLPEYILSHSSVKFYLMHMHSVMYKVKNNLHDTDVNGYF